MLGCIILFSGSASQAVHIGTSPSWRSQAPDWTSKIKLADINNDGYVDLIVANFIRGSGGTRNNKADIKIFRNFMGRIEAVASQVLIMEKNVGSWNIDLGDYDNDGDLDLAVGNIFEKKDLIFKNHEGLFEEKPVWESDDASVSHGLEWVDYDMDGDLDLTVSAAYSGVKIYENREGNISTHPIWESYEALDFQDLDWADMDGDGDFDLAVSNHDNRPPGGIFIFKSRDGKLPSSTQWVPNKIKRYLPLFGISIIKTVSWRTAKIRFPGRLAWADIDGDGFPELAVTNAAGPAMIFYNNKGILEETPYWEDSDNENSFDLVFADIDNDGLVNDTLLLDKQKIRSLIYLPHSPVHSIQAVFINAKEISIRDYCHNLKHGWISIKSELLKTAEDIRIDYTYSTDIDLIVAKSTWQGNPEDGKRDKIYLNDNGAIRRKADWASSRETLSNAVSVGDIDNDGDLDIILGGEVGREGITNVPQHLYLYLNHTVTE
jgi:hypothetical protein